MATAVTRPFTMQVCLSYDGDDESDATQTATELTALLVQAGYEHVSTTVLDATGEVVADFGFGNGD
jgi:hypothetical protein